MIRLQNRMAAAHFQLGASRGWRQKGRALVLGHKSWVLFPGGIASWGPLGHLSVPPFLHLCRGRMVTRFNDSYNHNVSNKIAWIPTLPFSLHLLHIILLFSKAFINMPGILYIPFVSGWGAVSVSLLECKLPWGRNSVF